MIEFLFGYWIGRDSQKDPVGTFVGLMLVVPGLFLAFWIVDAFVSFVKTTWALYLTYSTYFSTNADFAILAVLTVLNFVAVKMIGESKTLRSQLILLSEKALGGIVLWWALFDIAYKSKILDQMAVVLGGNASSFHEPLFMPFMGDGISFYSLTVGGLCAATILMPFAFIGMVAYMVYTSKRSVTENKTDAPC